MSLHLEITDGRDIYLPGDVIHGVAGWELEDAVDRVIVRLVWRTSGKGTADKGRADRVMFSSPALTDAQPFELVLPTGPMSYAGPTLAINWTVELVVDPKLAKKQTLPIRLVTGQ